MITSTANARVKRLLNLQKKRKYRDKEQVFLVEGIRMFCEVPREQLREIYVTEEFYEKEKTLIHQKENEAGIQAQFVSDAVFAHISDTKTPQGILCVVSQKTWRTEEIFRGRNPLLLLLDNLQDPGNLGTILRTAEGAGVTGIILSKGCVDIYNPKTIRSTMGSVYRVPFVYVDSLTKTAEEVKKRGIRCYAAHLEGSCDYDVPDYCGGSAFFIGNEGNGLRDEVTARADQYIRIPMCGQVESLNAAVAASVLMFEAFRQRRRS